MRISDWSSDVCSSDLLSRIDDIAFDRLFDVAVGIGGVVLQILDRLFAAPAFVVDAGVDDEAAGAPQLHAEPPEIAVGRSEERRVGQGGVSTCRSRWSREH